MPDVRPAVNGGDIHPTGDAILLRTDTSVWLYQMGPGQSVEGALASLPCELASTTELQGESIAWRADGNGYFTMSEGEGELIHAFSCL